MAATAADLNINVTATANTQGLTDMQTKLAALSEQAAASGVSVQQAWKDAGISFDFAKGKATEFGTAAANAATATSTITAAGKEVGATFELNRYQAAALSREIANGAISARTLGQSLAGLGNSWAIAAIGAFTVAKVIVDQITSAEKLNAEIQKQDENLAKVAANWERMAGAVTSEAGIGALAQSFNTQLTTMDEQLSALTLKATGFSNTFLRGLEALGAELTAVMPSLTDAADKVSTSTDKQVESLQKLEQVTVRIIARQAEQAQQTLADAMAAGNTTEARNKLVNQTIQLMDQQAALDLNIKSNIPTWIKLQEQIDHNNAVLALVQEAIKKADDQVKELDKSLENDIKQWERDQEAIEKWQAALQRALEEHGRELDRQVQKQIKDDEDRMDRQARITQQIQDEAAVNRATGDEEAVIQAKVTKAYHDKIEELRRAGIYGQEAANQANIFAESERQRLEAERGMSAPVDQFNLAMKQAQTLLQSVRQQQELIKGEPFMGVDAKNLAMLHSYQEEMALIKQQIDAINAMKAGGQLDPEQLARADQESQKLVFTWEQLRQKMEQLQQPLRTSLTNWANSFGSTMDQIGKTIEGTINTALQSLNTWITTGKFNAQQLLQSIIDMGLKLVEQLAIQRVMSMINASTAASQAAVTGPAIAAAYAPAATAATVASFGAAALNAPVDYAVALAAIQAMSIAHEGGQVGYLKAFHSGGLAADEELIVAQKGEIMIQKDVVAQPGMANFLLALNASKRHDGGDGRDSGSGDVTVIVPTTAAPIDLPAPDLPMISSWRTLAPDIGDSPAQAFWWSNMTEALQAYGMLPQSYTPGFAQGPTMPDFSGGFDPQGYPYAQAAQNPSDPTGLWHGSQWAINPNKHGGGLIGGGGFSLGGRLNLRRFHNGGGVSGPSTTLRGGDVHVHNYTDMRSLVRELNSREGRQIIVDTVRGNSIELGMR